MGLTCNVHDRVPRPRPRPFRLVAMIMISSMTHPPPPPSPLVQDITIKVKKDKGRWYKCKVTMVYNDRTNEIALENAFPFKTKINDILGPHGAVLREAAKGCTPWAGDQPCLIYEHAEAAELAGFVVDMLEDFGMEVTTLEADHVRVEAPEPSFAFADPALNTTPVVPE